MFSGCAASAYAGKNRGLPSGFFNGKTTERIPGAGRQKYTQEGRLKR